MDVHRRIAAQESVLLAAALAAAVALSDSGQWSDLWLLLVLLAISLVTDHMTIQLGAMRVSGGDLSLVLSGALAGPAPAAAIAVVTLAIDAVRARPPVHGVITNLAGYLTGAVVAGGGIMALEDAGVIERGEGSFAIAVFAIGAIVYATSFVHLAWAMTRAGGDFGAIMRGSALPMLPWEVVIVGLAAAACHAYETLGIGALLALGVLLVFYALLLRNLAERERQAQELIAMARERDRYLREALDAEQRERRRVAAELHDDALQTLLAARQDLADALAGDPSRLATARDAVADAVGKLRGLASRLHTEDMPSAGLGPAVRELADRLARRTGAQVEVHVEEALEGVEDPLAVSVARELLMNVAKHAHATRVAVRVDAPDGDVRLVVADDGVGLREADRAAASAAGHLGLSLVEQRVASRNGRFRLMPGSGGGTVAEARLRALDDRSTRAAQAASGHSRYAT